MGELIPIARVLADISHTTIMHHFIPQFSSFSSAHAKEEGSHGYLCTMTVVAANMYSSLHRLFHQMDLQPLGHHRQTTLVDYPLSIKERRRMRKGPNGKWHRDCSTRISFFLSSFEQRSTRYITESIIMQQHAILRGERID